MYILENSLGKRRNEVERLTERKWTTKDNTQPTIVLSACAHCGGMAEFLYSAGSTKVRLACRVCGMTTPVVNSQTEAVSIWNKRIG
jgi:hypothetical protein